MTSGTLVGIVLLVAGVYAVMSALPITHHLARLLPQWNLGRGDAERLGSTTFLVASIGLLMAMAGAAMIAQTFIPD